jgi:hypothetical protein
MILHSTEIPTGYSRMCILPYFKVSVSFTISLLIKAAAADNLQQELNLSTVMRWPGVGS